MTAATLPNRKADDTRRYWVLATVTLATLLFAMTVTISYVVLPQMQGSLSATQDQIAWSVTFNLVATAVGTPASGWLANRFGRRALMIWCVTGFSVASLLCGTATTLEELVTYRVIQGIMGAPITPVAQAIILGTFPRRQHGLACMRHDRRRRRCGGGAGPFGSSQRSVLGERVNSRWLLLGAFTRGTRRLLRLLFCNHAAERCRSYTQCWRAGRRGALSYV